MTKPKAEQEEPKELAALRPVGERYAIAAQEYWTARAALGEAVKTAKDAGLDPGKVHAAAGLSRFTAAQLIKEVSPKG